MTYIINFCAYYNVKTEKKNIIIKLYKTTTKILCLQKKLNCAYLVTVNSNSIHNYSVIV